eukprot:394201_1
MLTRNINESEKDGCAKTEINSNAFQPKQHNESNKKPQTCISSLKCVQNINVSILLKQSPDGICPTFGNTDECILLKMLTDQLLLQYNTTNDDVMDNYNHNSIHLVDCYLHVLATHNSSEDLAYITNQLPKCVIQQCDRFRRNQLSTSRKSSSSNESVAFTIYDKIHCYYSHLSDFNPIRSNRFSNFGYLRANATSTHERKEPQPIDFQYNPVSDVFSYGQEFVYEGKRGYKGSIVNRKFKSIKEELTQNELCRMVMEQVQNELAKAKLHYASIHRKRVFPSVLCDHLFVVMVYCNYYQLQYIFSSTYRKIDKSESLSELAKRHSNFFWFGMYLKEAVNKYGTDVAVSNITYLYHGISKEMKLPYLLSSITTGNQIWIPLSTSSSFEVALNFSGNHGLMVQFETGQHDSTGHCDRCFQCDWISDYPNE